MKTLLVAAACALAATPVAAQQFTMKLSAPTVNDMNVEYMKAIPHLAGELFAHAANIQLTAVHYRGAGPALTDLLSGQVQAIFVGLGVVRTHMAAGTVRVLAVSQPKRLQAAPEIPTSEEAGLPAFELNTWFGIVAPKGTPERIVATLTRQIHAMQDDPTVQKRFAEGGLEVLKETPAQFGARWRRDHEKFRAIVRAAGLKPA